VKLGGRLAVLPAVAVTAMLAGCSLFTPPAGMGTAASQPTGSASPTSKPYNVSALRHPGPGKFLGIQASGAPNSLTPLDNFAANLGRKPNLVGQYVPWGQTFDAPAVQNAWSYGALYYVAWEPFGISAQAIATGHADGYITQFARAVRTLNLPIAVSFGHEMNGNWYPWGTAHTTAVQFVAAWRHIHDLFARVGATNVIWVWNANIINPVPQVPLKPLWPGKRYVNWVGITGYFATTGAQTYGTLYQPTIDEIRQFTSKPVLIAETAIETGPAEVACAKQLLDTVTQHPDVLGFIWFDYNKGGVDWRVESRPILRAAMASDIARLLLVDPRK
jgi:mannan endo-1,4-beta-mannosidase